MLGLAALAVLLATGWFVWRADHGASSIEGGRIRIVSSPATARSGEDGTVGSKTTTIDTREMPLPDLTSLSVNERSAVFDGRARDPDWATPTEGELRRQLSGAIGGLIVQSARCADELCAVEGQLQHVDDRQAVVDQLVAGRLNPAYARAGLTPNGSIAIEADDAGDLHFTQYLQRQR